MNIIQLIKKPANIYTILLCIYNLQGILYPVGSIYSRSILLITLIWGLISVLEFIRKESFPKALKLLFFIILLLGIYTVVDYIVYGAFISGSSGISSSNYLKGVCISAFPIFVYYSFSVKGYLSDRWFKYWFFIFAIITTAQFYYSDYILLHKAMEIGSNREEFTHNEGYFFLGLIPITLFLKDKPLLQYVSLSYVAIFILLCMKRGAILGMALCLIIYLFKHPKNSSNYNSSKLWIALLSIAVIALVYYFANYLLSSSDYFEYRVEQTLQGDASGRETMYREYFSYFVNETNPITFLFGSGINSTVRILGNGAHDDWLQMAIEEGLIGVIFLFSYWRELFKTFSLYDRYNPYKTVLLMIIVIEFIKSIFSFSLNSIPFCECGVLAYCLANQNYELESVEG